MGIDSFEVYLQGLQDVKGLQPAFKLDLRATCQYDFRERLFFCSSNL